MLTHQNKLESKEGAFYSFVLFLVWPFIALLVSIKNYRQKYARNIVWLFTAFYGFTFVYVSDQLDADRIVNQFNNIALQGNRDILSRMLWQQEGFLDVLQPFLIYLVSRFTGETRILFAAMGLIFGYFYSRNIWFLLDRIPSKINRYALPFLVLFTLLIPIWEINGFRMWTAAHIFIYGSTHYLYFRKWKYLIFVFITPLVHFSFLFALATFLIYFLLRVPFKWFFLLFFITFFIQSINIDPVEYKSYAPEVFHKKIEGYGNQDFIKSTLKSSSDLRWFVKYRRPAVSIMLGVTLFLIFLKISDKKILFSDERFGNLLKFSLFFSSMSNLLTRLPFADNLRFYFISFLFQSAILFLFMANFSSKGRAKIIYPFVLSIVVFYSIVELRIGLDRLGISTLIGNPITALFTVDEAPLIVAIKEFF